MKKLVPLIAALSFAAAIPAYAATHHPMHARHAQQHVAAPNDMAPQPMQTPVNSYKAQDLIISHVVGVPG